jgi:hypothetical protein
VVKDLRTAYKEDPDPVDTATERLLNRENQTDCDDLAQRMNEGGA